MQQTSEYYDLNLSEHELRDILLSGNHAATDICFIRCTFDQVNLEDVALTISIKFTKCIFKGDFKAQRTIFQKALSFNACEFGKSENDLIGAVVDFRYSKFQGAVVFSAGCVLGCKTYFDNSVFCCSANFNTVEFGRAVSFANNTFEADVTFQLVTCHSEVRFSEVTLLNRSGLNLENCMFLDDFKAFAWEVDGYVSLAASDFKKDFSLTNSSISNINLVATKFALVPNFMGSVFREVPRLDMSFIPRSVELVAVNYIDVSKYRYLKKLALQAEDHDLEKRFFSDEMLTRMKTQHNLGWLERFCYFVFHSGSDFGRNIAKPLKIWLGSILFFGVVYYSISVVTLHNSNVPSSLYAYYYQFFANISGEQPCETMERVLSSIYLSIKTSLVFIEFGPSKQFEASYSCLFEREMPLDVTNFWYVPVYERHLVSFIVSFINLIQIVISVVMIFLFSLGLRNKFKT